MKTIARAGEAGGGKEEKKKKRKRGNKKKKKRKKQESLYMVEVLLLRMVCVYTGFCCKPSRVKTQCHGALNKIKRAKGSECEERKKRASVLANRLSNNTLTLNTSVQPL